MADSFDSDSMAAMGMAPASSLEARLCHAAASKSQVSYETWLFGVGENGDVTLTLPWTLLSKLAPENMDGWKEEDPASLFGFWVYWLGAMFVSPSGRVGL